ncbi:MAG: peptidylprolyl isomerase [Acidobacteriota bacterium]
MTKLQTTVLFLLVLAATSAAQIPIPTLIRIAMAEDARRYDSTLEALMRNRNFDIRRRATLAAGRIGDEQAIPVLVNLLENDMSDEVRAMAAFGIGEIESITATDVIVKMLEGGLELDVSSSVKGRLVEAAGKIAASNSKDERSKRLGAAIIRVLVESAAAKTPTQKAQVRLALTAVLRAHPAGAEDAVRRYLFSTDPEVVADALNTLARLRAKNANRDARDLLSTNLSAIVRANAARVLAAAEDKESVDIVIKAAAGDRDKRVRVSAIRSLAALKDEKAAGPLIARGEELIGEFEASAFPLPAAKSELLEIFTTLGLLIPNSRNERAVDLIRKFAKRDQGHSPEAYIARLRIAPGRGDNENPELKDWQQFSTLAQVVGEFASIEPTNEEGQRMKSEAPGILRPLAQAFAAADPDLEGEKMKAAPDVLQAYARFKTDDLAEIGRKALYNKDVQTRVAAAGILADLPPSDENASVLKTAFLSAMETDRLENDAQLAILDALLKLDKRTTLTVLNDALTGRYDLVRRKAREFLLDRDAWKDVAPSDLAKVDETARVGVKTLRPYDPKSGTKLGQVLNTEADYRRALGRKNGSVKAVLTTEKGTFTIDLLPEYAPLTVDNFIKLARANYFNGLQVHRVVPNFVMQDGDPRGDGNGGPGWTIRCEVNMVPYERGVVGMALSGKDTGGSQWFVTHSPQPHLDGGYTVFGKVNETGMKVVDNIVRGDKIITVRIVERVQSRRQTGRKRN